MNGDVVVIGVGNAWRHDDGAGLEVARRAALLLPERVRVVELDGEPTRVVDAWEGASLAVLVDAVRTGASAGEVRHVDMGGGVPEPPTSRGSSHALGPAEAYRLARVLGRLPDRLVVLGVEVGDVTPGVGLSPAVDQGVARAVEELVAVVARSSGVGSR